MNLYLHPDEKAALIHALAVLQANAEVKELSVEQQAENERLQNVITRLTHLK